MSRTKRLWRGVGPLTLGGLVLSAGLALAGSDPSSLADQLVGLGRTAAARGQAAEAKTFYQNALKYDPNNAAAKSALSRMSLVRRVSMQDPVPPPPPQLGVPEQTPLERQAGINSVAREQFVSDIGQRLQSARDMANGGNPEGALATLRDALVVVQAGDALPEDIRRRLENQVRNAIGATEKLEETNTLQRAERYRVFASQAARTAAVDLLLESQQTTNTLMTEFDILMTEGQTRVLKSGGLGDIDTTRQPFVDARLRAQDARANSPLYPGPLGRDVRLRHDRFLHPVDPV